MKTLKLSLVWMTLCVLTYSCKKNSISEEEETAAKLTEQQKTNGSVARLSSITSPGNPANPVDTVGARHNEDMDYIFAHVTPADSDAYFDLSLAYIESKYGPDVRETTEEAMYKSLYPVGRPGQHLPQPGAIVFGAINDFTLQDFHDAISSLPYSPTYNAKLIELVDIMADSTTHDIADYDVVKGLIINWENQVTSVWTGAARDRLLGAGSIARHSMYYWQVYDETHIGGGSSVMARGGGGFLRWLGWGLVGASDAIGFIAGAGFGLAPGIASGSAGSWLAFKIFKKRGWKP